METKICNHCHRELPIEEFGKNPGSKDGHINICKRCNSKNCRTPDKLVCPVCNKELDYFYFDISKKSKTGRVWCCKNCYSNLTITSDIRTVRRKYDEEFKTRVNKTKRESRLRNYVHAMWKAAKTRAESRGLEFNIEESDIINPETCPILECPIKFGTKEDYNYSPSLDRIDNSKGYVKGNIMVISKKANTMKNSASLEELQKFCKNVLRYSPNYAKNEGIDLENKESLR